MLVAISDLHFVDGSVGNHNVPTGAFENVFLSNIKTLAERVKAKEVKLLLLGDIVDLLRTNQWFDLPIVDRPWGKNGIDDLLHPEQDSVTLQRCAKILGDIYVKNDETFALFRNLRQHFGSLPVEIIYVPGNHDRLVNCYPLLRDKICQMMGISSVLSIGVDGHFLSSFRAPEYGLLARHGHEFDSFNYAGDDKDSLDGHMEVPFGDVVTTEIAAQLAFLLLPKLDDIIDDPDEKSETKELICQIDNIRPWTSIGAYLVAKFGKNPKMWAAVTQSFGEIVANLLKIEFFRNWVRENQPTLLADLWNWIEGRVPTPVSDSVPKDQFQKAALEDYESLNREFHFVLYGHTHFPAQVPLDHGKDIDAIYINTGTWRSVIEKIVGSEPGYVSLKTMTYATFYREDEDRSNKKKGTLSFDIWTGWESKRRK